MIRSKGRFRLRAWSEESQLAQRFSATMDYLPPIPSSSDHVEFVRATVLERRPAHASFERALVRQGRSEHEWLQPEESDGSDYEREEARVLVLADRCLASTDGAPIEIELVIARGTSSASAELLYRLSGDSWLAVEDAWDWPMFDAVGNEREERTRVELPDGRVRITARLEAGGRLCVRLPRGHA